MTSPSRMADHPASRAEELLSRIIATLAMWARGRSVHLRSAEVAEVSRWATQARQEVLALRGPATRTAIPATMRARVIARAGGRCEVCGAPIDATNTHVDHIIPVARFGATRDDNLRATCADCNLTKGAREAS